MDIDQMLSSSAEWLMAQSKRPLSEFLPIANALSLRDQDWSKFWKLVQEYKLNK